MKPEDAAQQYEAAMNDAHATVNGRFTGVWRNLNEDERDWLLRFASAIESHVRSETAEMCKAKVTAHIVRNVYGHSGSGVELNWSAVDAALNGAAAQ